MGAEPERSVRDRVGRRRAALTARQLKKTALARYFLALGTTAFGGPAAHIAMMEEHVVRRNGWMTHEEFLDLLGAANLIPGPSSTELAIFIGYRLAGWAGLAIAGVCFILPAFLIVAALAWMYARYGALPAVAGALYGVKPVVIAIILQALRNLGQKALKTRWLIVVASATAVAATLGVRVVPVLGIGALLACAPDLVRRTRIAMIFRGQFSRRQPPTPWALGIGHFFSFLSKSARFFLAVATSCSRSWKAIWSSDCIG